MDLVLFPFGEYWWFYLTFTGLVLLLLALDLGVFHRKAHSVTVKEALTWSFIWIVLSLAFNFLFYEYALWKFPQDARLMASPGFNPQIAAKQVALEFLTGYIVEKSLSVDNLFVFVLVFSYFAIPSKYQHRVLFYGILGALILRGCFIAVGSVLMRFQVVVLLFGVFLIFSGVKIFFSNEDDDKLEPEKNPVIKLFQRLVPVTNFQEEKFFLKVNNIWHATPLFITLLFLEMTDLLFAVDSVPAIFALTREPLIVFTSNIFAILGLRAMYFLLANAMDKFHLLKFGLGVVLTFVGLKMTVLHYAFDGKFPISISLAIILGVLILSISLSLIFPKAEEKENEGEDANT